jgi:hypothetical protein
MVTRQVVERREREGRFVLSHQELTQFQRDNGYSENPVCTLSCPDHDDSYDLVHERPMMNYQLPNGRRKCAEEVANSNFKQGLIVSEFSQYF